MGQFPVKHTIGLAALSLTYPAQNLNYQIELIKSGTFVNDYLTKGTATFYDLQVGTYELKVKAKQTGAQWSEVRVYTFTVYKEWYQTVWFQCFVFLVIASLIYLIIQLYNKNLRQTNEKLEQLVRERTATLETQKNELMQNQQQIKNSIKQNDRWEEFRLYFEQVHGDFYAKLKVSFPDLTTNDLKQCALVKLNLSLDESATLLGVSSESVRISRYRIQKKMGLNSQAAFYEYLVKL